MLIPRQKAPDLVVDTLDHGRFDLSAERPQRMTLICFYRGLHCPICANYLKELERLVPEFAERGVAVIAISSDNQERARQMADKIAAKNLRFGYSLALRDARTWGLYLSTSRGKTSLGIEEPPVFSEPGVFLINADQTVYFLSVQSMPFVRPHFAEMIPALDFIIKNEYPGRGEFTGAVPD